MGSSQTLHFTVDTKEDQIDLIGDPTTAIAAVALTLAVIVAIVYFNKTKNKT
jgi:hypothetical protein